MTPPKGDPIPFGLYFGARRAASLRRAARRVLRPEVRFTLGFVVLAWLALQMEVAFVHRLRPFTLVVAEVVARMSSLVGLDAAASGDVVTFEHGAFAYQVTLGCTGLYVGLMAVSAVLAYPVGWRERLVGVFLALPAVVGLNLFRLVAMGGIGLASPAAFHAAHEYWWQAFLIVAVGFGWIGWARWATRHERPHAPGGLLQAVAVFFAAAAVLGLVGTTLGVPAALDRAVAGLAMLLGWMAGVDPASLASSRGLLGPAFSAVVALASFVLATPRVGWRARAWGVILWVVPSLLLMSALGALVTRPRPTWTQAELEAVQGLVITLTMVVPLGGWLAWVSRSRLLLTPPHAARSPLRAGRCPQCRARADDLAAHVRKAHRRDAARILHDLDGGGASTKR